MTMLHKIIPLSVSIDDLNSDLRFIRITADQRQLSRGTNQRMEPTADCELARFSRSVFSG